MHERKLTRRRDFLKTALGTGAAFAAPCFIPGAVPGKDGATLPSEKIVMGAIGIGARGSYVIGCFLEQPDVRFVANCDVPRGTPRGHQAADRPVLRRARLHGLPRFPRPLGPARYRRGFDYYRLELARRCFRSSRPRLAKTFTARSPARRRLSKAWRWPTPSAARRRVFQGGMQRRSLPHFQFAADLARRGKLGTLQAVYAHPCGLATRTSGWLPAQPEPSQERSIGTCTWAPPLGGRSTSPSWAPNSRRAVGLSAAAAWNGVRIASINANGPIRPTTPRRSSTFPWRTARRRHAMPTASSWWSARTAGCR